MQSLVRLLYLNWRLEQNIYLYRLDSNQTGTFGLEKGKWSPFRGATWVLSLDYLGIRTKMTNMCWFALDYFGSVQGPKIICSILGLKVLYSDDYIRFSGYASSCPTQSKTSFFFFSFSFLGEEYNILMS